MKVVVDTNIVFSAILNSQSKIGQLIINGTKFFDFYTVVQMKYELFEHQNKIQKIAGYTEEQFIEIYQLLVSKIRFVDDILISDKDFEKAIKLVSNIDEDDAMFVALANHLHTVLWTGDKQLSDGLTQKGFSRIISTSELYEIYIEKELKSKR